MTTKRWVGQAQGVYDVWTISLSGTVVSQTYTITINSKTVVYTATGLDTPPTILAALVAAWTSTTTPPPQEFNELTPVAGTSTIVATGKVLGKPSTIAVATDGGAAFSIAHTTSATGPNDFTAPQNYSTGTAPANSDVIVFDNGNTDCLYNLGSVLTGVTIRIEPGYTGKIGLPLINNDAGQTSYKEYRTTHLTLAGGTLIMNAPSCQRLNIDFGANAADVRILNTGGRIDQITPPVLITGGNGSSELDVTKGDVGIAYYAGETAQFPTINTGFAENAANDVSLQIGSGTTLTTLQMNGGAVWLRAAATTAHVGISGGKLYVEDVAVTTITAVNGTVYLRSESTIGTVNLYNQATFDCDTDPRDKDVTNPINVFDNGVTIKDNEKTINSGTLELVTSSLDKVNVFHGGNLTMTFT